MPATPSRTHRRSIHDYRILQPLGSGPSGEVFRARDLIQGGDVALKRFRSHSHTADDLSRYAESAAFAADIPGTAACRLIELVPDVSQAFAVLEFIPGQDLGEYLKAKGPLSWPDAHALFGRIAAAVATAHRADLVHGALKPTNIRVIEAPGSPPLPRILDFGIVALRPPAEPGTTRIYEPRGIEYQAPEQLSGQPATAASDFYSLGVLLFEALTGHPPFAGRPQEVAQHHLRTPPASPRLFAASLPTMAEKTVLALLAKPPEARKAGITALLTPLHRPAVPAANPDDDLQTMTFDRSKLQGLAKATSTRERTREKLATPSETVVLPAMPSPSAGGHDVTMILDGMNREILLDHVSAVALPSETTSEHTHPDATIIITRMPPTAAATPQPAWRRWIARPWTLERQLIAACIVFIILILFMVALLATR